MMKIQVSQKLAALFMAAGVSILGTMANASVIDLANGNTGTVNGAQFDWTSQQPTGTGVIAPFLRVQADGNEQGYNTSGGTPFDEKAGIWTHNIQFSDLQATTVTLNGGQYFKLLLDVNEPGGSKSLISLDQLVFYSSPVGSKTTTDLAALGTLRWSLDGAGDSHILLDASRNNGSGSGDMYAYIPVAAFAGTAATDYIYMYTRFGDQVSADGTTEGGFEEWALVNSMTPVPEAGAFFPIIGLAAAIGCTHLLRKRRAGRLSEES